MLKKFLLRISKKWIAGEHRKDAFERARHLNRQGIKAIINFLGEHFKHLSVVDSATKEYLHLISDIKRKGLNASVSVKLSELGLEFSKKLCKRELGLVLEKAAEKNVFVWIDMESHKFTEKTIEIYLFFMPFFDNVGITIQSSLKRSKKDLQLLLKLEQSKIRLVKGAYKEPVSLAFKNKREIRENFLELMLLLFAHPNHFAVATHDLHLINEAVSLSESFGREKRKQFEFQMLMGLKNKLKKDLARKGYNVSEYVPYGKHWLPYVKRRLSERKENFLFVIKSIFE